MDAIEKLGHSFACVCVISLFEVISLLHPWVTCLPGWNRKTGAFICLFCDYFAIKFLVSFFKKIIISLFEVISLLHPWVTCLPGCNRKTGAFICLFCDYFAIKF